MAEPELPAATSQQIGKQQSRVRSAPTRDENGDDHGTACQQILRQSNPTHYVFIGRPEGVIVIKPVADEGEKVWGKVVGVLEELVY